MAKPTAADKRRKKAVRQKRWRDKMINDPKKAKTLSKYREDESERQRKRREMVKAEAGINPKLKAQLKEKERVRKAEQRMKKRKAQPPEHSTTPVQPQSTPHSSQKKRRVRETDAKRKASERNTQKMKQTNNRLRVALFRLKKKNETQKESEQMEPEANEQITEDLESANAEDPAPEHQETSEGFRSRSSKYRAVMKVREAMPETTQKKVEIIERLTSSPATRKTLEAKGLIMSEEEKLKAAKFDALKEGVSGVIEKTKPGQKGSSRYSTHVYQTVSNNVGHAAAKFKVKKEISKDIGMSRKQRKTSSKNINPNKLKTRKKRSDATNAKTIMLVKKYYMEPEISRIMPNKKDVMQLKDDEGVKTLASKYVMSVTQREAFQRFKAKFPTAKLGQRTFDRLKPKNVRRVNETSRMVCLCTPCQNVSLKTDVLKKVLNNIPGKGKNDEERDNLLKTITDLKKDKHDIVKMTMCEHEDEFPKPACLDRTCKQCGPHLFRSAYKIIEELMPDEVLKWDTWKYADVEINGEKKRKIKLVGMQGTSKDFMDEFEESLKGHASHLFRSSWQFKQQKLMQTMLQEGQAWLMLDFAEDFNIKYKHEVQSAYWMQEKITIHPIYMMYQKLENRGDQENPQMDMVINKHSFICVSDESSHDADAVLAFTKAALNHLKVSNNSHFEELIEFTDGAPAQYKGRTAFADVAQSSEVLGVNMQRHFSETSHGKGICDGIGGMSKFSVTQAVLQERVTIKCPFDYFTYGKTHLEKDFYTVDASSGTVSHISRTYLWIPKKDIEKDRPDTKIKTIPGTRKMHCVKGTTDPNQLLVRDLSCFCTSCVAGASRLCKNKDYTGDWRQVTLQKEPSKSSQSKERKVKAATSSSKQRAKAGKSRIETRTQDPGPSSTEHPEVPAPEKPASTHETPLQANIFQIDTVDIESYVAVYYEKTYYVGRILKKDDAKHPLLTCKFLRKTCGSKYVWPKNDDIDQISSKFVFAGPLTILGHGPFTFEEEDNLNKLYQNQKKVLKAAHATPK